MAGQRKLTMQYAGGLIKHLGFQMYSGAVPAIAELVANAWDADARNVWIDVPVDVPIRPDLEITLRDDGHGMTFDDVNARYLVVGLDRRAAAGTDWTPGGRRVMGRKGIGKLAGFGIAHLIDVWTVKDGWLTAFRMDYDKITRGGASKLVEPYEPDVLFDREVREGDPILSQGTLVVLKRLQLKKRINGDEFRASMVRRFSVLSATFLVSVNGNALRRGDMEFEFRFPEKGTTAEDVTGIGQVVWWAGFTRKPIESEEARGITVLARGKLAQTPFFFNFTGGVHGQFGMEYLTGEVEADFLDEEVDLIATDRASVRWEDPRAQPLVAWGQEKLRDLLGQWAEGRQVKKLKKLRDTTPYLKRIERFPERERRELTRAIERLASIETIEDERLAELVDFLIKAYENENFMMMIRQLNAADPQAQEQVFRVFAEWDVLEAIATANIVRGRVEVIRKFRALIETKAPEKPVMQDFLKTHPWLIEPGWDILRHERALDTVIAKEFGLEPSGEDIGGRRLDFFCLADSLRWVVVEVKRPGDTIGKKELDQLWSYVDFLRRSARKSNEELRFIQGCLIYSDIREDAVGLAEVYRNGKVYIRTWDEMLRTAESLHRDFLDVVKERAPKDDPRLETLEVTETKLDQETPSAGRPAKV